MIVKAVRKGYYKKLRVPGEQFNFSGKKCPSWCVEKSSEKPEKSSNVKASEASAYIETLTGEDAIMSFIEGEERSTVIKSAEERIKAL